MKILLPIDDSPASKAALEAVAAREWPPESEIKILNVIYTRIPQVLDPLLVTTASHIQAIEEARERAPTLLHESLEFLRQRVRSMTIKTEAIEAKPEEAIVEEARNWGADLIIMGTDDDADPGEPVLGLIAGTIAENAPCRVDLVLVPSNES